MPSPPSPSPTRRTPGRALARRLTALAVLGLLAPPAAAAGAAVPPEEARWAVETRQGALVEGRPVAFEAGRLDLLDASGERRAVALADVLLIWSTAPARASAPDPSPAPDVVVLRSGDVEGERLVGRWLDGDGYGIRLQLADGPTVAVPFDLIERLLPSAELPLDRLLALQGGGADDRLWRREGRDSLTGVLDALDGRRAVFEGALGVLEFAAEDVLAVVLAGEDSVGLPAGEGPPIVVRLRSGARLSGRWTGLEPEGLRLATAWEPALLLPHDEVAALARGGPDVVPLTALAPLEVAEWPSVDAGLPTLFPWRAGLTVTGRPLDVGGRARVTGLGLHANARFVYQLPPAARVLRLTVGLCDEVEALPARASMRFELLVDDAAVGEPIVLAEGDRPVDVRLVDLSGGERFALRALDGGDDDAGDRGAVVDALVLLEP